MRLRYGGPTWYIVLATVFGVSTVPVMFVSGVLSAVCVQLVAVTLFAMQKTAEAHYWKSKAELDLDIGVERALRDALPGLVGDQKKSLVKQLHEAMKD